MVEYKTLDELNKAIEENGKVIVKISTNSCMPCKMVAKTLEELEKEREDVVVVGVDAEECDSEVLEKFGVRGVPVVLVFKNGELASKTVGLQTKEQIVNRL